jgi:hypothetical protein
VESDHRLSTGERREGINAEREEKVKHGGREEDKEKERRRRKRRRKGQS